MRRTTPGHLALLFLGCGTLLWAQQAKWEELKARVEALYQQGEYAEAIPVAREALRVAERLARSILMVNAFARDAQDAVSRAPR